MNDIASIVEQVVDVLVRDLCEWRLARWILDLLQEGLEDSVQLFARLLHPQSDETEARLAVEDDDENDSVPDELDVNVRLFALVELSRELVLAKQLRHAAGRGDVAGRQRSEGGGVEVLGLT